jgi:hypothetical protein
MVGLSSYRINNGPIEFMLDGLWSFCLITLNERHQTFTHPLFLHECAGASVDVVVDIDGDFFVVGRVHGDCNVKKLLFARTV